MRQREPSPSFLEHSPISMTSQKLWRAASQKYPASSLNTLRWVICRGQAPVIVYTPIIPSKTEGLCMKLDFCSQDLRPKSAGLVKTEVKELQRTSDFLALVSN